jgi:hypothetical protein
MTNDNTKKEIELKCNDQFIEITRLKDLVRRQHYIIDYLENRLLCALIDADYAD